MKLTIFKNINKKGLRIWVVWRDRQLLFRVSSSFVIRANNIQFLVILFSICFIVTCLVFVSLSSLLFSNFLYAAQRPQMSLQTITLLCSFKCIRSVSNQEFLKAWNVKYSHKRPYNCSWSCSEPFHYFSYSTVGTGTTVLFFPNPHGLIEQRGLYPRVGE